MKAANVQPDLTLYNRYLAGLKMEGKDTEAQRVVDEDMRITMAIEPNKRTLDTLQLEADNLSKMRTARLDYYLRHGGDGPTAAAEELFHTLVEHKLATLYQFSATMNFCHDSNGMWNIMNVAKCGSTSQHRTLDAIQCSIVYRRRHQKKRASH